MDQTRCRPLPDARRRPRDALPALDSKFSPSQPRVPAGNSRGGQWTSGNGGGGSGVGAPPGGIGFDGEGGGLGGDIAFDGQGIDLGGSLAFDSEETGDPFSFLDLIGRDSSDARVQLIANEGGSANDDPPPEIPQDRPGRSEERTSVLKDMGRWLGRNAGKASGMADVFLGAADQVDWLKANIESIKSYSDPPRTMEELQARIGLKTDPGYEDHHIVERNAENNGISKAQINSPENVARIPVLKHYEITGYYKGNSIRFPDGSEISPREYLTDKTFEERMQFGLDTLRRFEVLK